jgi:hypothetical protein
MNEITFFACARSQLTQGISRLGELKGLQRMRTGQQDNLTIGRWTDRDVTWHASFLSDAHPDMRIFAPP